MESVENKILKSLKKCGRGTVFLLTVSHDLEMLTGCIKQWNCYQTKSVRI